MDLVKLLYCCSCSSFVWFRMKEVFVFECIVCCVVLCLERFFIFFCIWFCIYGYDVLGVLFDGVGCKNVDVVIVWKDFLYCSVLGNVWCFGEECCVGLYFGMDFGNLVDIDLNWLDGGGRWWMENFFWWSMIWKDLNFV